MGQIYQNLPSPFPSSSPGNKTKETAYGEGKTQFEKIKRAAKIFLLLLIFIYAFFHYFIYWDPANDCFITIKPSFLEFSNLGMKRALLVLKHGSPKDYQTVCRNVNAIEPFIGCGGFGGGCFYQQDQNSSKSSGGKEIYVSTAKDDLITTAAVIVHETCHAIQEKEGRKFEETECYEADDRLLRDIVTF